MKLLQKILRKLKYLILTINYKLFYSKPHEGYNNLALNKSIIKKTIVFSRLKSPNEYDINFQRTLDFLEFIKKKKLKNIIDFGGGAGYHYFIAKMKLPDFNFKWLVIENRTMVKLCNKKLNYKNLFFFNSLNTIKKTDVFFSSSAINYTKDPIKTIKSIIKLNAKYLYFTRTPLAENQSLGFKQISLLSDNGPCKINNEKEILIECENKIVSRQSFESMFKNKFVIIDKYIDQKKAFFFQNKKKECFDTYTYIFKKK
jgi:putative methyltransferase (TIGR04325 family)